MRETTTAQDDPEERPAAPRRRRSDGRFANSTKGRIILAAIGLLTTLAASYGAGLKGSDDHNADLARRLTAVEAQRAADTAAREEQYKALMSRIDDIRDDIKGTRTDINGVRDEIMRILRAEHPYR